MNLMAVRGNPELLIIENPGPRDKAAVWRTLRRRYEPAAAAASFNKIYPGSITTIRRNKGGTLPFDPENKEFKAALKIHNQFHGKDPEKIFLLDIPEMGDSDDDLFFVLMGEAPAESYVTDKVMKGSSKDGSVWVHPYERPEGKRPWKIVSSNGRLILTVPGKHVVRDFIYH
jgi:hypothetical protein